MTRHEIDFSRAIYKKAEILRNKDGHVCSFNVSLKDKKYCQAYCEHDFPVDDCLNPEAYGVIVTLWRKKPDFKNIPMGEPHYDFDTVIFNNAPAGMMLFNKKKPKTIVKLFVQEALRLINQSTTI